MKKYRKVQLFFVITVFVSGVLCGKTTPCENHWTAFEGSCYMVGHDNLPFIEADRFCQLHNAHLAHINDDTENTFLKSFLGDLKDSDHWIGLSDSVTEGIWRWTDTDTRATYLNWYPGDPNGGKSGNCVAMRDGWHRIWVDEPCSTLFKALCEKRQDAERNFYL